MGTPVETIGDFTGLVATPEWRWEMGLSEGAALLIIRVVGILQRAPLDRFGDSVALSAALPDIRSAVEDFKDRSSEGDLLMEKVLSASGDPGEEALDFLDTLEVKSAYC
ncbi:MAG: hypothetical protein U9M98_00285 [Patescibacteria group bacterium]|nr:hypothetical protein [Patescibacteria group bacterium]